MGQKQSGRHRRPLALAIDVGSSSVRALLFDATGNQLPDSETQISYTTRTISGGGHEVDPANLLSLVVTCIDGVIDRAGQRGQDIGVVSFTTFWHSLLGLDANGKPVTPIYMWSDTRSNQDAMDLREILDERRVHAETGCRLHSSYWPAKIRWLRRCHPDVVRKVSIWASPADYFARQFHGDVVTSVSMASGTGLLDERSLTWHDEMTRTIGINSSELPPLVDRYDPLPPLLVEWAERWPMLARVPWLPAIGDGAAANVGAHCVGPDRIALTIGTSGAMRIILPAEREVDVSLALWKYRLDSNNRVIGGALSSGGGTTAWLRRLVKGSWPDIEKQAAQLAPDSHGLTVLPFLSGERSPSWDDRLGGTIIGIRQGTMAHHLTRAFMEATAYRFGTLYDELKNIVHSDHSIYASGGTILWSGLWQQIVADTLNHNLHALPRDAEASARGTAVCGLEAIGVLSSTRTQPSPSPRTTRPDCGSHIRYNAGRARQQRLEFALTDMLDQSPSGE